MKQLIRISKRQYSMMWYFIAPGHAFGICILFGVICYCLAEFHVHKLISRFSQDRDYCSEVQTSLLDLACNRTSIDICLNDSASQKIYFLKWVTSGYWDVVGGIMINVVLGCRETIEGLVSYYVDTQWLWQEPTSYRHTCVSVGCQQGSLLDSTKSQAWLFVIICIVTPNQ